jgi:outer membrane protein assembly factor BamD
MVGCSKKPVIDLAATPQEEFSRAMDLFQMKNYRHAAVAFQNVVFNFPGSGYAADAQFYLAESYFLKKDFNSAIPEYEFFINSFPGNQYLEDAYYKLALSYFKITPSVNRDPSIIEKTAEVLEILEERFPETKYREEIINIRWEITSRWAEKQYRIGELYYKGEEYGAARIYFNVVQDNFPQTKWAEMSRFMVGQILEKNDSLDQAIDIYHTLISEAADSTVVQLVEKRLGVLRTHK